MPEDWLAPFPLNTPCHPGGLSSLGNIVYCVFPAGAYLRLEYEKTLGSVCSLTREESNASSVHRKTKRGE